MSESPLPNVGSTDSEVVYIAIQRTSDRFSMPDLSVDPKLQRLPRLLTSSSSTNSAIAAEAFDSVPDYGSSKNLGDAFARAESIDLPPKRTT